jgi:hypothetical protein
MASLFPAPQQYFDNNGDPLAGGKVYFYDAGTTTPKNTYTDQSGATPNANPVILDSAGRASIWGTGAYKEVVRTSANVLISTKDSVTLGTEIASGYVTNAMLADMPANSIKARSASTTGVPNDVALSASTLLGRGSTGNVSAITLGANLYCNEQVLNSVSPTLPLIINQYYGASHVAGNAGTNLTALLNRLYAIPIYISSAAIAVRIGLFVATSGGTNARMGIYDTVNGQPKNLVLDAGIVTTVMGTRELTISQSLSAGWYWLVYVSQSGGEQVYGITSADCTSLLGVSGSQGENVTGFYKAFTYAALPSDIGSGLIINSTQIMPRLVLRF